jgi:hypothetical protein
MPPTDRFVISFAAEPPQEGLPYGRWAETLKGHFLTAVASIDTEGEEIGEAGEIGWFPATSPSAREEADPPISTRARTSPRSWPKPIRTGSSTSTTK